VDYHHQRADERQISTLGDDSSEPKTGADFHTHSHPESLPLSLDSQFIALDLAQLTRSFDQMLLHRLSLLSSTRQPVNHSAFVKVKSRDDSLNRAAVSEQGDDLSDDLLLSAKTVKGSPQARGESLFAEVADEATLFDGMNADVALGCVSSGRAVEVGAKYGVGVQTTILSCWKISKGLSWDSLICQRAI
jgi:hypothetical protein